MLIGKGSWDRCSFDVGAGNVDDTSDDDEGSELVYASFSRLSDVIKTSAASPALMSAK